MWLEYCPRLCIKGLFEMNYHSLANLERNVLLLAMLSDSLLDNFCSIWIDSHHMWPTSPIRFYYPFKNIHKILFWMNSCSYYLLNLNWDIFLATEPLPLSKITDSRAYLHSYFFDWSISGILLLIFYTIRLNFLFDIMNYATNINHSV